MMIRLDPFLTLLTVVPLPLLVLLFIRTGTRLDERFDAVQQRISGLNGAVEACFSGIRVVKAYGREQAEDAAFARFADDCRRAEIAAAKSMTIMESLYGQVWQLGVVVVLLAGGAAVMSGRMTLGTFIAFDAYVLMLIFPMLDIGAFIVRGRQSGVSIGRLREIEETPVAIVERADPRPLGENAGGALRFESVGYSYAEGPVHARPDGGEFRSRDRRKNDRAPEAGAALADVTFTLDPGQMLAVVGKAPS